MARISISSPFPVQSQQGNSISAARIGSLLESRGNHAVSLYHDGFNPEADLAIVLNAWRSAATVARLTALPPPRPGIVVMMTGSDLFPLDGIIKPETLASIAQADAVVLSHPESQELVPHPRIRIIRKSILLPHLPATPFPCSDQIHGGVMVSHLRAQKNPFLYLRALPFLHPSIRLEHYGSAHSSDFEEDATRYRSAAYEWKGEIPRLELLDRVRRSAFILNTSHIEGSSNALCEAIALRIPVIASRIPGNTGLLGSDYPGLFEPDQPKALAAMLNRFASSEPFRLQLQNSCERIASNLDPEREASDWIHLISEWEKGEWQ